MAPQGERMVGDLQVTFGGTQAWPPALARDFLDGTVVDTLGMASKVTLRFNVWDQERQEVTWADRRPLGIGAEVAVNMGWIEDPQPLFRGEIVGLEVSFSRAGPQVLTVTGYDFRGRLLRGRGRFAYSHSTDSAIAAQVVQRNELIGEITATATPRDSEIQRNESDLAFLQRLAQRNGFEVAIEGKTVRFGPPKGETAPIPLSGRGDLDELSASLQAASLADQILVRGRDAQRREVEGSATIDRFPGQLDEVDQLFPKPDTLDDRVVQSREEAAEVTAAERDRRLEEILTASGSGPGNPAIRAGRLVEISGVGNRFSGRYRVTSATHAFAAGSGYRTSFSANWSRP